MHMYTSLRSSPALEHAAAMATPRVQSPRRKISDTRDMARSSAFPASGISLAFERNQAIFDDGEPASHFYKVTRGAIRLCKLFPDGRRQVVGFCFPGEYFGLCWQGAEYTLTAEAASDTTLVRFNQRCLFDTDSSAEFRSQLISMLFGELSLMQNHLLMLGRQTVKERVASFFLMVLERQGVKADDNAAVDLLMGRQDIADYLGLTIETVCRTISDLKRAGIIAVPGVREIVVEKPEELRSIASGDC